MTEGAAVRGVATGKGSGAHAADVVAAASLVLPAASSSGPACHAVVDPADALSGQVLPVDSRYPADVHRKPGLQTKHLTGIAKADVAEAAHQLVAGSPWGLMQLHAHDQTEWVVMFGT